MSAPSVIKDLIKRFERNREAYHSPTYNETQLRREFLDPFLEALGWDVQNKQGYSEAYKDVVHEDAIKAGEGTRAPDYCFRIGGTRKFFVEAKKPAINIREDPSPAFQLRRYAWSAKLPLSILTDFEEFAVYDCRIRPHQTDKASAARLILFTYEEYLEKWEEIASIFSRDAVLKGSFDKYAESKRRRGTAEVDDAFLSDIEMWRKEFAQNFALRNERLSQRELNFAVGRTIDRIIFLRVCEDRGIEPYGQLRDIIAGRNIYEKLFEIFRRADDRYNSGLFHFQKEMGRAEDLDELTPTLTLDDKPLKEIIQGLYYPDSPYEFSVLSADILGQVYEQFLGKVIRLTEGHHAKVEDKPEVKKAGGVYYTPTYIVDYIVKHTVGKLLEGKTPKEVAKLRILDPACGSGSFLIGAYQYLLDWYLNWYTKEAGVGAQGLAPARRKARFPIYQTTGGQWRLTPAERKRILLNNIYGVDIDPQAVEVSKLSLLLKALEGETHDTLESELKLGIHALPDLGSNIKCGNSLIGPDFYDHAQMELLDDEEKYRINAFDWNTEFASIMKAGGFDAVIGNPPWGSMLKPDEKRYLDSSYVSRTGEAESHLFFLEKGQALLAEGGLLSFITPNTWLAVVNSREIRRLLLRGSAFLEVMELSKYIFEQAPDIVPVIVLLQKTQASVGPCVVKRATFLRIHEGNFRTAFAVNNIDQNVWTDHLESAINIRATPVVRSLLAHCHARAVSLGSVAQVLYGIKTGDNSKYLSSAKTARHLKKALKTGELTRYSISWKGLYLWWNDKLAGYRKSSVEVPKIIVQYIRKLSLTRRIIAAVDASGEFYPLNNYSYITVNEEPYSLLYLAGIINSSLVNYYYANTFIDYNIKPTYLSQLPIRTINLSDKKDKTRHDKMVKLVERMLELHKQLAATKTPDEKTRLERQIAATDKQIDNLVYELYGLTEEEIKIVEGE